ncbi:type III PLP-dependent enzyme [Allokutzneria multivorans]|uniref:ornithine decarboxylase n=1 Tax=Allokutzneria multivorans TaxID=1142134 RepID=A0ABP7S2Z2_9PSEU
MSESLATAVAAEKTNDPSARIRRFLDTHRPSTPCLVLDLDVVEHNYRTLRDALPDARIFYAVKANPHPEVVRLLVELGACFDVASTGEIDLCLAQGAAPEAISYGNTIKKAADIAYAFERGVRLFVLDSAQDVRHLAEHAPGASVFCRVLVEADGARTPFGKKFGCAPDMAVELLREAGERGLDVRGISFHVGSQHVDPAAWELGITRAAQIAGAGVPVGLVNLGGGFPSVYTEAVPALAEYAAVIERALDRHFPGARPELIIEPGRALVGDAGMIRSEVVLVSRKSVEDTHRWVYLDIGRYNGMAECEGEAIAYELRTERDGGPDGPVVIAGPTCDGDDVLYQRTAYRLPLALVAGDHVDIPCTGAYTASYSSVSFNGFPPLTTHVIGAKQS